MHRSFVLATATLVVALAACSTGEDAEQDQDAAVPTTTTAGSVNTTMADSSEPEEAATTSVDADPDPGLEPLIEMAINDLSDRLEAEPGDVVLVSARLVTWPDSSMGCPEPDRVYLPVVADGSVIELAVGDTVYTYHTGGDIFEPFLCEELSGEQDEASSSNPLAGTPLDLNKPIEKYPDETVPPPGFDD